MFRKKSSAPNPGRRAPSAQPSKNKTVFSYYQNRDTDFDARQGRERPSFLRAIGDRLKHLPTLIAAVLILISVLWALSLESKPRVTVVNEQNVASSAILRPPEQYQEAARELLDQSPLTGNKLTLDTEAIERALQEKFSEITNVAVVLPLISRTPVVYVQVAEPVLVLENGSSKFVIDEKGRAVIAADQVGDLKSLKLTPVKDAATLNIKTGEQVLTGKDVQFMRTIREQLALKGAKVSRMELPARAGEVYVYLEGKPYFIKFTTTGDALLQAGTYLALDPHLAGKKVVPKAYVDVRVPERHRL